MSTRSPTYLNFELQISQTRNAYRIQVLDAPAGRPSAEFINPFTDVELKEFAQQIQAKETLTNKSEPAILKQFGERLYNALFHSEILAGFQRSLDKAKDQKAGLRIRLRLDEAPELISLPWEYLYDAIRNRFLVLSIETPLTHFPGLPDPSNSTTIVNHLRVLTLIAAPIDLQPLDSEREWLNLQSALAEMIASRQVDLQRLQVSTMRELQDELRRAEYHILHFIGHGLFDEAQNVGLLFFTDETQQAQEVTASTLGMLLHNANTLRLIVLNACEGARTSQKYQFAGTAQSLVQQGVPAVIAMQQIVSDRAAKTFSYEFYRALVDGYTIEAALTEARVAVRRDHGSIEWGTPRLYMHTDDGQLWQKNKIGDIANTVQLTRVIFEDGGREVDEQTPYPPLPEFDASILKELEPPSGALKIRDRFYVEREADGRLREQLLRTGTTTVIRAPRQTGKTSLLSRGIHHANEQGIQNVYISFQPLVETGTLTSLDKFLYELGGILCRRLRLDKELLDNAWRSSYDAPQKLTFFLEDHVFSRYDTSIVLAIDEADSLLTIPYAQSVFSLLRFWHEQRAFDQRWNLLNLALVISTEPYLLIQDINQSPFNVGERLELVDFTETQVQMLNQRHGSPVTRNEMPYFIELLGGHPYLTRMALYEVVKQNKSWATVAKDAVTDHGIFRDHLQRLFGTIYKQTHLKSALLTIIRTHRCSDQNALLRLLRAGVIKGSGDSFSCRCELYRRYLEKRL